ncbi:MAG TPA: hypothetical protein VGU21_03860 [Streptosporangiaceae bacterium]|nr:hypothetical protein [Streptosporangiaceae bacterium]
MVRSVFAVLIGATAAATVVGTVASAAPRTAAPRMAAQVKAAGQSCRAAGFEPVLKKADFQRVINNRYFPLPVGRTLTYRGIKDGKSQVDVVHVTSQTKVLEGITTVAVSDIASHQGKLLEKTTDWYAQDKQGNVWYMGEFTTDFSTGHADHSGSWKAGVNDGEPGIVMQAVPQVPNAYRQECQQGVAEDMAWTVIKGGSLQLPFKTAHGILTSLEFSRIEPSVIDLKVYAPGLGIVLEQAVSGPKEVAKLVSVHG